MSQNNADSSDPNDQTLPDPQTLDYEAAKEELKEVVTALESGSAPLEETLKLWQRGEALAARCRSILEEATKQVAEATGQVTQTTELEEN